MIIEIPTSDDFTQSSINLLNLAWKIACSSLEDYKESIVIHALETPISVVKGFDGSMVTIGGVDTTWTKEERAEAEILFWNRSQPTLGNALSLLQQSIELGIKGRIAAVSPYLLISRDTRDYPNAGSQDIPFSEFRSIDSSDLVKVHNMVCSHHLTESFNTFWKLLLRQRNMLIHSVVPARMALRPQWIMENVLYANSQIHPGVKWFGRRREYLEQCEQEVAHALGPEFIYNRVLREFDLAFQYLSPRVQREYFGVAARGRQYMCIHCWWSCERDYREWSDGHHAQLHPRSPSSRKLLCAACGQITPVIRKACVQVDCNSNVLVAESETEQMCLMCGKYQSEIINRRSQYIG